MEVTIDSESLYKEPLLVLGGLENVCIVDCQVFMYGYIGFGWEGVYGSHVS